MRLHGSELPAGAGVNQPINFNYLTHGISYTSCHFRTHRDRYGLASLQHVEMELSPQVYDRDYNPVRAHVPLDYAPSLLPRPSLFSLSSLHPLNGSGYL